jgi:hypothetical protein
MTVMLLLIVVSCTKQDLQPLRFGTDTRIAIRMINVNGVRL